MARRGRLAVLEILTGLLILVFVLAPTLGVLAEAPASFQCTDCQVVMGTPRVSHLTRITDLHVPRQDLSAGQSRHMLHPIAVQTPHVIPDSQQPVIAAQVALEVRAATWFLYTMNPVKASLPCLC